MARYELDSTLLGYTLLMRRFSVVGVNWVVVSLHVIVFGSSRCSMISCGGHYFRTHRES